MRPALRFGLPTSALALLAVLAQWSPAPPPAQPRHASNTTIVGSIGPEVTLGDVLFYYQSHNLSCEEAAVSMALTHQGIFLDQEAILRAVGHDPRVALQDSDGRLRWGDPYRTFVGSVDGHESTHTGYGVAYPPLVEVARAHGAKILKAGAMDARAVYAFVWSQHPVVVWATYDWRWHERHDYLAFDGRWIPWIGPADSHVYTVIGIRPGAVLVDDPIRGRYWVAMDSFEAAYSVFQEAIAFA